MKPHHVLALVLLLAAGQARATTIANPFWRPPTIGELLLGLGTGERTSKSITQSSIRAAEARSESFGAVLALNPAALGDAEASDRRRAEQRTLGPLDGIPILVKDNIEARGMPTTAGSLALKDNDTGRDATVVRKLREAGVVFLGKANLSEWANIRSSRSTSGWSAVGGLTVNPRNPERSACGSSSGSAAAVAAGFVPAALGTETDGSITCPAAMTGIVGFKPTVGLVSRHLVIPISRSQDTVGPMAQTVRDAAMMLTVIAGSDPADPATREADAHAIDFAGELRDDALRGARLGVLRSGADPATMAVFQRALERLRGQGAELVEVAEPDMSKIHGNELTVLLTELKADLDAYLATTDPSQVATRTLADVIAFNAATPEEMTWFGQELFEQAKATSGLKDPRYRRARATSFRHAGPRGIDAILKRHDLDAIVAPTTGPAWKHDLVNGDHFGFSSTTLPAVAGYPHLTVPMGYVHALPVGLSFIGPKWSDARILSLGHAFQRIELP